MKDEGVGMAMRKNPIRTPIQNVALAQPAGAVDLTPPAMGGAHHRTGAHHSLSRSRDGPGILVYTQSWS